MRRAFEESEDSKAAASTTVPRPLSKGFQVLVHGVVEGAECFEGDLLFARTQLFFGADWSFLTSSPLQEGRGCDESDVVYPTYNNNAEIVTQVSDRTQCPFAYFSWAAPFEFALHSTNPHGWPQLVITLHSVTNKAQALDAGGKDSAHWGSGEVIIAYSRCFVPMTSGYHKKKVSIMQLENATKRHQLIGMLTREKPVLRDLSYLCRGDDRVVLTARPVEGHVKVTFSVMITGMEACGFEV